MANVTFFNANPVYQAPGEMAWNITWGDRDNYWGFSVRPFQANNTAVLKTISANSDNNLNQSTDLVVDVISAPGIVGGLLHITGTRVTP